MAKGILHLTAPSHFPGHSPCPASPDSALGIAKATPHPSLPTLRAPGSLHLSSCVTRSSPLRGLVAHCWSHSSTSLSHPGAPNQARYSRCRFRRAEHRGRVSRPPAGVAQHAASPPPRNSASRTPSHSFTTTPSSFSTANLPPTQTGRRCYSGLHRSTWMTSHYPLVNFVRFTSARFSRLPAGCICTYSSD